MEEGGAKIRVIHDATHEARVNHRIRPLDQLRSPGAGELRTLLRELRKAGQSGFAICGDIALAHRRVKVRVQDHGYQACRLEEGYTWINGVGTYGLGSAAYWWARVSAAVLVRMVHYIIHTTGELDLLLYVDDEYFLAVDELGLESTMIAIFLVEVVGGPWSWKKFRGGVASQYVGLWVDLKEYRLGVSASRAAWVRNWVAATLQAGVVDVHVLAGVAGRMGFAAGALDYVRPFLAPVFAWVAARGHAGRCPLPWSLRFILTMLADNFSEENRTVEVQEEGKDLGEAFRSDAKAEGQHVCVGAGSASTGRPLAELDGSP